MTDNSDKEHIQIKPRGRDQWVRDWPIDFLNGFLSENLPEEKNLKSYDCLPFLNRLGYKPEAVYTNLTYDVEEFIPTVEWFGDGVRSLEVDTAAAKFPERSPHLVVNAHRCLDEEQDLDHYVGHRGQLIGLDKSVALDYLHVSDAKYSVLLSNVYIIIAREEGADWFDGRDTRALAKRLKDVDWDFAKELKKLLRQPKGLAVSTSTLDSQTSLEEWAKGPHRIENDYFAIDLKEYRENYQHVHEAKTNTEKKKSLENLSCLLFESISSTRVKETNFRGKSNEIDLIVETIGADGFTLFDEYGQYTLVECKNWTKPVGAKEVRDFAGKMETTGVQLGILFAREGVTGDETDAERMIDTLAQNGRYIIVIDGKDLKRIADGRSFYEIIDEKLWRLRFEPYSSDNTFTHSDDRND